MRPSLFKGSKCQKCRSIANTLFLDTGYYRSIELLDARSKTEKTRLASGAVLTVDTTRKTYNLSNIMDHFVCYTDGRYSRWQDFKEHYLSLFLFFALSGFSIVAVMHWAYLNGDMPDILYFVFGPLVGLGTIGLMLMFIHGVVREPIGPSRLLAEVDRKAMGRDVPAMDLIKMDKWNQWLHKLKGPHEKLEPYELTDFYIYSFKEERERKLLAAKFGEREQNGDDVLEAKYHETNDVETRMKILRQIKDPSILSKICLSTDSDDIALGILDLVEDDFTLEYIARCASKTPIIRKSVGKINDTKHLKSILECSINDAARRAVVSKIEDDDYLLEKLLSDDSIYINTPLAHCMVEAISDKKLLYFNNTDLKHKYDGFNMELLGEGRMEL